MLINYKVGHRVGLFCQTGQWPKQYTYIGNIHVFQNCTVPKGVAKTLIRVPINYEDGILCETGNWTGTCTRKSVSWATFGSTHNLTGMKTEHEIMCPVISGQVKGQQSKELITILLQWYLNSQ